MLIHFFRRHRDDDPSEATPTVEFLDSVPDNIAAEIQAALEAVAAAPPPSFSGGGKWEAMHDEMAGFYEVRVQGAGANHRLFCILQRIADDSADRRSSAWEDCRSRFAHPPIPGTTGRSGSTPPSSRSARRFYADGRMIGDDQVHVHSGGECNNG